MLCPNCGTVNLPDAKSCTRCGRGLGTPTDALSRPGEPPSAAEPPYVGFWIRFVALVIDNVVLVSAIGVAAAITVGHGTQSARGWLVGMAYLLAPWLYFAGMESSALQATLGKLAVGIKVTDLRGHRVSFLRATGRYFAKFLSALTLSIGYAMAAFTARRQALHDKVAETLVVRRSRSQEEIAAAGPAPAVSGFMTAIAIVGILLFGPFGIGMMAGIAIPAYQDYTIRAQVTQGLAAASAYKAAVAEAVAKGQPITTLTTERLNMTESTASPYVDSIKVMSGIIVVTYGKSAHQNLAGKRVLLIPGSSADGPQLVWVCGHHTAPPGITLPRADLDLSSYTTVLDRNLPLACKPGGL